MRKVALGAYAHSELPFESLVEELHPQRSLSHSPLCQVMFAFQNTPRSTTNFKSLTTGELEIAPDTAKFDLTLSLSDTSNGLRGWLEFSTDLFEPATIERMVGHWVLLEGIVADPDRRISELPLLTERERQQLLVTWNDTTVEYPHDKCVHELFEQQVAQTPEAIAMAFADQQLSYRELSAGQPVGAPPAETGGRFSDTGRAVSGAILRIWWSASWAFSKPAQPTCPSI